MNSPLAPGLQTTLKNVFGFSSFRANQEEIVRAVMGGGDAFAVMPTGGGKSLCYQLPALLLSGTCLVISPLISLMKDQVDHALSVGIKAGYLNSSLPAGERRAVERRLRDGGYDLLYLAPERLATEGFARLLKEIAISFVAVDEAHCLSEWGHDFRPDYLSLSVLKDILPQVAIAAFTATATRQVGEDIIKRLRLQDPFLVRASFDRPNLIYKVLAKDNVLGQIGREVRRHPGEAGIVYRLSRKDVENTALHLQGLGIVALPYHAGLSSEERHQNQEAFNRDEIQVIVATVAFGMGIDKSNVRYVIHGDLPKNIDGYYQETGRAGRDGDPAHCLLLYSRSDMVRLGNFISQLEDRQEQNAGWQKLGQMADFAEKHSCRRRQLLGYFEEVYAQDNCGACDVCLQGVEAVDATTEAQMVLSAIYRTGGRFGAGHIIDIVVGARTKRIKELGHTELKTHGVGKHHPKPYWRRLVDALLVGGSLQAVGDKFPVLTIAGQGEDILFGRASFAFSQLIALPDDNVRAARREEKEYDQDLFALLHGIRRDLADQDRVPPYVIFSDRSLREMCQYFPASAAEMPAIHGVGMVKLERYGAPFLAEIGRWLADHPEIDKPPLPALTPPVQKGKKGTKSKGVSKTMLESGALAQAGLSLAEIAKQRGIKEITVAGHLEAFLEQGKELDLGLFVSVEKQELLGKAFEAHGFGYLSPVVEGLGGQVSYDEARIMRGFLRGQNFD